ncbi:hypothetical protein D3C87_20590 [compost metagenome]
MKNRSYILNLLFLPALTILLLNDFYWKETYSNGLTGKLSDVFGLVVFVLFFSALLASKFRIVLYLTTALLFVWWKSTWNESFIDTWNQTITFYPLERTVDYSDSWCLLVLIPLYFYHPETQKPVTVKWAAVPLLFTGLFAIVATSKAKNLGAHGSTPKYWIQESFKLKMTKADFLKNISFSNISIEKDPDLTSPTSNGYYWYLLKNFTVEEFNIETMSIGLKEKGKRLIVYVSSVSLANSTDKTIKTVRKEIPSELKELLVLEH